MRDLRNAFTSCSLLYIFIGLFGGIGIIGREVYSGEGDDIVDFFS